MCDLPAWRWMCDFKLINHQRTIIGKQWMVWFLLRVHITVKFTGRLRKLLIDRIRYKWYSWTVKVNKADIRLLLADFIPQPDFGLPLIRTLVGNRGESWSEKVVFMHFRLDVSQRLDDRKYWFIYFLKALGIPKTGPTSDWLFQSECYQSHQLC